MKETNVGLGEQAVSRSPDDVLVAYGLGSCVGVVMIDPVSHTSGLLHAVLPKMVDGMNYGDANPSKYVEGGVEGLIAAMVKEGANKNRLIIRIIGGANMLIASGLTRSFDIGTRNIEAVRTTLSRLKMPIAVEEVGGHTGRTVRVYVADSRVTVRVIGEKEREI
jgi:Chemotaxis protein; stimulates methylation of MCP proteins